MSTYDRPHETEVVVRGSGLGFSQEIYCDERFPQFRHQLSTLEGIECLWSREASSSDNMERPELRAARTRDDVRPSQRVHGQ